MDWMADRIDAVLAAVAALLASAGIFVMRERRSRGGVMLSRSQAHQAHAKAESLEVQARGQLDDASRDWAEKLIARYDAENEELRVEIREARQAWREERRMLEKGHARERAEWEAEMREMQKSHMAEIAQLRAQIIAQQKEITSLRALLERREEKERK